MSKLVKEQLEYYKNTYDRFDGIPSNEFETICDELIAHKKIEEELDFPLDIAFRALKEGIYIEQGVFPYKSLEKYTVRGIELNGLGVISNICAFGDCDFTCEYKDYKKTWWLKKDKTK